MGNLQERYKLLESGSIELKEPQILNMNTSIDKYNYATLINQ